MHYSLISCPLCKSNTLWNILMILGSNEEQDQTTCHIQEWQLWLCLLLELSPLLVFEFYFLSLLCNTNTLRNILMMLGTNIEQDEMTCCVQEWQLWRDWGGCERVGGGYLFFSKKPFLVSAILAMKNLFNISNVVEPLLCDREVVGSIPGRVIPKTLKMVLAALSLGAQH